jgi:hypothetical protein
MSSSVDVIDDEAVVDAQARDPLVGEVRKHPLGDPAIHVHQSNALIRAQTAVEVRVLGDEGP